MSRPTVVVELGEDPQVAQALDAGGLFVPACELGINEECELVVKGPSGETSIPARCVYVDPATGSGLELLGFGPAIKERLLAIAQPPPEPEPEPESEAPAESDGEAAEGEEEREKLALNVYERLRGLTLAQQVKMANHSDPATRMALERIYGKSVWEPLLRNNRLTAPEVARIARMGALPRPQIETIVSNGAWLQMAEVRRALLTNPRLGTDQINRVLRMLPKHELKVASSSAAYTFAVRNAAKAMLSD